MASRDEFETEGSETGSRRSTDDDGEQDASAEAIAQQESRDVVRLRLAVLLVLVSSAAAVAASIYCHVAASEESHFRERFEGDAHKVLEAVGSSIDQTYGALDSVAVSLVSHAKFANMT
jgi:hypothetical protein